MVTRREIAERIAEAHTDARRDDGIRRLRVSALADAVDEALRNERERCAKIAEDFSLHGDNNCSLYHDCHELIASAIRRDDQERVGKDGPQVKE